MVAAPDPALADREDLFKRLGQFPINFYLADSVLVTGIGELPHVALLTGAEQLPQQDGSLHDIKSRHSINGQAKEGLLVVQAVLLAFVPLKYSHLIVDTFCESVLIIILQWGVNWNCLFT